MNKIMCIGYDLCTGCTTCQMVCSLLHGGECSPKHSRIHIIRDETRAIYIPILCVQCTHSPCLTSCPVGAISRDKITHTIRIEEDLCDGCGMCVTSCPYGAISLHPGKAVALVCDLCGGKPQCVEFCPTGVLCFCPPHQFAATRRRNLMKDLILNVLEEREKAREGGDE